MKALLIVDMQKDFMPGGPLETKGADALVPLINQLMGEFSLIVATKDWHPKDHLSFVSSHPGKKVGESILLGEVIQTLWPVHCVQESPGSEFARGLDAEKIDHICYKGVDKEVDSYSAFFDNGRLKKTGLEEYLRKKGVTELVVVGVATDYCVLFTVLDALELGFSVTVLKEGCRGINLHPDDEKRAFVKMEENGARMVSR
ncbi:MAG: Peroxyureidoacrylate/ureidoacrylate amidohydrolase RutB [Chlamydiae bacterium]|nr:Peroxyureidoacrylate/ureidoacrylate amidohydrolase RutB [Chlamydiota bacterium]